MKKAIRIVGAVALLGALAAPSFAQIDASTLTCGQFYADGSDKEGSANALVSYLNDANNASAVNVAAAEVLNGLTNDQVQGKIDNVCEGQSVDATILSLLK